MDVIKTYFVPVEISEIRLLDLLLQYGDNLFDKIPSRNYAKKVIKRGEILVNGNEATTGLWIRGGEKIELLQSDQKPLKVFPLKLDVIFEDEYLAVINKPAGIVVSGNKYHTIENALMHNLTASSMNDALIQPRAAHRLDALTAGLLIIAKTRSVRQKLGEMFAAKDIEKTYHAIVIGNTPEKDYIDTPINGQTAISHYIKIAQVHSLKCEWLSLLELKLETGRTHQLRIHLSEHGFPILGDKLYGNKNTIFKGKGLFLCAVKLEFIHPVTNENIELGITAPNKFKIHLERETKRFGVH